MERVKIFSFFHNQHEAMETEIDLWFKNCHTSGFRILERFVVSSPDRLIIIYSYEK